MKQCLLVVSHGYLAHELLNSASMIVGEIENAAAIGMTHNMGLEETTSRIAEFFQGHQDEAILVLADLFGGTPFNAALLAKGNRPDIEIVTGVNLGMLLEYSTQSNQSLTVLAEYLKSAGKQGIQGQSYGFDDDIEID